MWTFDLAKRLLVCDALNGAHPCSVSAPLTEPLVLPRLDQIHPSTIVWMLIEEPVAISHIA